MDPSDNNVKKAASSAVATIIQSGILMKPGTNDVAVAGGPGFVGEMSQQTSDPFQYERYHAKTWPPGIDLGTLATFYLEDPNVNIACNKIVEKVCGQGIRIEVDLERAEKGGEDKVKAAQERFDGLSGESPFIDEFKRACLDRVLLGNGALEVARNGSGEIDRVYWLPATELRVRIERDGFVQKTAGGRYQIFNNYEPDPKRRAEMMREGKWHRMLNSDGGFGTEADGSPWANEVMFWKAPNPASRYYGLPQVYVIATDSLLNRSAKLSNLAFFNNGMMPDWAIIVTGGALSQESLQLIQDYLSQAHTGPSQHHGMLYISAMPEMNNQVKVEMVPLQSPHKDMAWQQLDETTTHQILRNWGMSPMVGGVMGDGKLGGGGSERETTDSFKFEVIEPFQTTFEYTFTRMLVQDMGFKGLRVAFRELDLHEERQNMEIAVRATGGAPILSVNEARALVGKPPSKNAAHDEVPDKAAEAKDLMEARSKDGFNQNSPNSGGQQSARDRSNPTRKPDNRESVARRST